MTPEERAKFIEVSLGAASGMPCSRHSSNNFEVNRGEPGMLPFTELLVACPVGIAQTSQTSKVCRGEPDIHPMTQLSVAIPSGVALAYLIPGRMEACSPHCHFAKQSNFSTLCLVRKLLAAHIDRRMGRW
eukprot:1142285-Pelagomonas_calceolata.AAC.4